MGFKSLLFVGLVLATTFAEQAKFNGYKVFRITPKNEVELEVVKELEALGLPFWDGPNPSPRSSDIMFPPHMFDILDSVRAAGLEMTEFISDVQSIIDETSGKVVSKRSPKQEFAFDQYHTYDDIIAWVKEQAQAHSDVAQAFSVGNSTEGRELLVLKISTRSDEPKRAVWLDANIHAREWITSAVCVYIINELLNGNNPVYTQWIQDYDWYILPVHNPDGFVFSHTGNRMWRKTRSNNQGSSCKGADPNRNFGFHWLEGGSSTFPCSDTYAGPAAFSEPETYHVSEFINTIATTLEAAISLHSYTQLILIPYGVEVDFPGHDVHMAVGRDAAAAIYAVHQKEFEPGNIIELLYVASGGSMDWIQGVHNVPLTYTFELRDQGMYGFILPADQIIPSGEELMEGLNVMVDAIRKGLPTMKH